MDRADQSELPGAISDLETSQIQGLEIARIRTLSSSEVTALSTVTLSVGFADGFSERTHVIELNGAIIIPWAGPKAASWTANRAMGVFGSLGGHNPNWEEGKVLGHRFLSGAEVIAHNFEAGRYLGLFFDNGYVWIPHTADWARKPASILVVWAYELTLATTSIRYSYLGPLPEGVYSASGAPWKAATLPNGSDQR